ncbi:MAG: TonB-dependent receptor [Calditrichia bacterium]
MMRFIISIILSIVIVAMAQSGTIQGVVLDRQTGAGLAGADLYLKSTRMGTTTDAEGYFILANVPAGKYTLEVSYLGYHTATIAVTVQEGQNSEVKVNLEPTPVLGRHVVVVATRAREGETPAAFTNLSREEIKTHYYAQDIPVLLSELPSTTFYSESGNGIGYNYLSIRGFGQRRISVMINGVPQNDPEDHNVYWVDFPDLLGNVEDIQVQRGAGNAFYGPPAIGGSVNIITSHFSNQRGVEAYAGGGSYNTRKYSVALNTGLLKDRWVFFSRLSQIKSDGYRDRSWVDFKSYFLGAAYFGKKSVTRIHFYGGPIEDHLAYAGISKEEALSKDKRKRNPIARPDEVENFNQPHLEIITDYELNDRVKLSSTLFGIRGYGFFDYDGSWAPMSYYRLTPEYGFAVNGNPEEIYAESLLIRAYVDNKQIGWLPQVYYKFSKGSLVAGAEIRFHRSLHWGRIQKATGDLPVGQSGEYRGLSYIGSRRYYEYKGGKNVVSPYFHATYRVTSKLSAMMDLQFAYKKYKFYDEKFLDNEFDIDYKFLNPRIGLNYKLTPVFSVFSSFSVTSREPRLKNYYDAAEASQPASWGAVVPLFERNVDGTYNFDKPLVNPERLTDYEFGLNYQTENTMASINLYYMDFRDEIIKKGQVDRFGQPITGNADKTLHRGVEFSLRQRILPGLQFTGNATYSQNILKEYYVYDGSGNKIDLSENKIAGFPDFMANARLLYQVRNLSISLALQHVGEQYTDNTESEELKVDAYTVANGMIGYHLKNLAGIKEIELQFHLRNIFNKLYITHGEGDEFFPAAERNFFVNTRVSL